MKHRPLTREDRQRLTVLQNAGRLTRAAQQGYIQPVTIKGKPERYLNSHARTLAPANLHTTHAQSPVDDSVNRA